MKNKLGRRAAILVMAWAAGMVLALGSGFGSSRALVASASTGSSRTLTTSQIAKWEVAYPESCSPGQLSNAIKKLEKELARHPKDIMLCKKLGVYWHARAAGDKGVLADAQNSEKMFEAALKLAEADKQLDQRLVNNLKGWRGAALAIKPKFKLPMLEIIRASSAGSRLLDRAVHDNPNDLELRFVRANTYIYYPPNLGKLKFVIEDIHYLLALVPYGTGLAQSPRDTGRKTAKGQRSAANPAVLKLYVMLAYAYHLDRQSDQSKIYMDKVAVLAPQSEFDKKVRELCSN